LRERPGLNRVTIRLQARAAIATSSKCQSVKVM
jgi:hypothetical protein